MNIVITIQINWQRSILAFIFIFILTVNISIMTILYERYCVTFFMQ
jgi:hypothetical protein